MPLALATPPVRVADPIARTALAEFAATRSADAFRRLVAQHVDAVYAHCLRRLDDPAAAEDATQAVFVALAQRAARLPAGTVLGGWLYVTAQNVCHNARRARTRRQHHERKAAGMRPEVQDGAAESAAQWRDVRRVLDDAIAGLAAGLRDAVVLRFLDGR
ncbi:sigma-70 family RNA polymerase sigma factor, partial [bacterium]